MPDLPSAVATAIAEVEAALTTMAPAHEGLRDYARLNLQPDTLAVVNVAIADYDRRTQLVQEARTALVALRADGYPALDLAEVTNAIRDDLAAQKTTIDAALGQFKLNTATGLGLQSGVTESKT